MCFTIQSVCLFLPYQSFASPTIKLGWVFEISFRLFATLLRTYSDGSAFSLSKIRRTGNGSFLKLGNAGRHLVKIRHWLLWVFSFHVENIRPFSRIRYYKTVNNSHMAMPVSELPQNQTELGHITIFWF